MGRAYARATCATLGGSFAQRPEIHGSKPNGSSISFLVDEPTIVIAGPRTTSNSRWASATAVRTTVIPTRQIELQTPTLDLKTGRTDARDGQSCNPRPSRICGIHFSIRAILVADCFAPLKYKTYPRRRPGVSDSKAALKAGSCVNFCSSSTGN